MGITLPEDEAWAFIERSHTGILTTLRMDGSPVALPVWFVTDDRRIHVGTPAGTRKLVRIHNDDRASFLVESGTAWVELAAVHLPVRARLLDSTSDADEVGRAGRSLDDKYADFRPPTQRLPGAATRHYSSRAVIRLEPVGPAVSWDNARIRLHDRS